MQKRTLKVALLAVLSIVLVLGMSTVALADQTWPDLPDTVTAKYGITDNQISEISEGYANGLWKPYQAVTRAQFTKMAVEAFNIPLVDAATASFTDVAKGSLYYPYIEGAKAAGVVNGLTATTFGPNTNITRQQALAIIARYVAKANGYTLATMYTEEEITALLAHFGDAASISAELRAEMAFAYDFGITKGNDYGNLDPLANLTRIQGAAMLIRAQAKVPPAQWTAAKIELVSADKTENLIGVARQVTFEVTTADGHPAIGVPVDFDELTTGLYMVGNIDQEAALTNNYGQVTVNMISTEPGTQRMSAAVAGVGVVYTTAYWVALDEVYITDKTREAENNAGESHTWGARVVVMGPGPLSTSVQDWYNAVTTGTVDLTDLDADDGVDATCDIFYWDAWWDAWDYGTELVLKNVYDLKPRTLAGVSVNWSIVPYVVPDISDVEDVDFYGPLAGGNTIWLELDLGVYEKVTSVKFGTKSAAFYQETSSSDILVKVPGVTVPKVVDITVTTTGGTYDCGEYQYIDYLTKVDSVGDITAVDGVAITAAKTATGTTNADGYSSITITSNVTGKTNVRAVADYAGNPYPKQLFTHETFQTDYGWHDYDWSDQPADAASALKTWIPHVIGGDTAAPIEPAYAVNNVGEVEKFTLTLKDTYGNVIPGYTVMWWIQGVGEFKSDGTSWSGIGEQNKDVDTTNAAGQSSVYVTTNEPGQTILHCKVVDKYGLPYKEWNVVKQWYAIDDVSFLPTLDPDGEPVPAVNLVGTTHTFTLEVSGMKYVHVLYDVNENGLSDDQVLLGERANLKALPGYLINFDGSEGAYKPAGVDLAPGAVLRVDPVEQEPADQEAPDQEPLYLTRYADYTPAAGESYAPAGFYDYDPVTPVLCVWSVLPGKNVWFYNNIGSDEDEIADDPYDMTLDGYPYYVGSITSPTTLPVVTDANGQASVTITSNVKGYQFVWAVVDYDGNPLDGDPETPTEWYELKYAMAEKTWVVSGATTVTPVYASGQEIDGPYVEGARFTNPVMEDWYGYDLAEDEQAYGTYDDGNPNYDILLVAVFDEYGNALPGYKVTYELLDMGETDSGTIDTYHPYAHFAEEGLLDELGYDFDDDYGHMTGEVVAEGLKASKFDSDKEGIFDRNRNVDANPIWDDTDDPDEYGRYDADKAVGYTLDGEVDNTVSIYSAAFATLVLDETYADLFEENDYEHVTSRINVQVWAPDGSLLDEQILTKVWSSEQPAIDKLNLALSRYDPADYNDGKGKGWTTSLTTAEDLVYIRVQVLDQYGDPWTEDVTGTGLTVKLGGEEGTLVLTGTPDDEGYLYTEYTYSVEGSYTLRAWLDDGDEVLDSDEYPRSNSATYKNN